MPRSSPRQRKVYRGEALRAVAMPLGGIGTGTIALCGDGSLRQWQIHNQANHLACVPHSFFAIWTHTDRLAGQPIARVLQSSALYDHEGMAPPPTSNDQLVPATHRQLLKQCTGVQATEYIGEYPIAELRYLDPALPLQVTMEAFSPFIPLDSKNSGLPAIVFNLAATNPTEGIIRASFAASLQNTVGWDGIAPIFGNSSPAYGGNSNSLVRLNGMTAINMVSTRLPEDDDGFGSTVLAALSPNATCLTQWDNLAEFWADFSSDGRVGNLVDTTPSRIGHTWSGALAVPFSLEPGESRTTTFIIGWYFPNRYINYSQRRFFGIEDERSRFWIGNQYGNWFCSALDAANYLAGSLEQLTAKTRLARDTFYDTTLPHALIDAVTAQISVLRSPTCFWAQDGRLYGFEGCNGASTRRNEPVGGCCPLNCTHVWNYEMTLARLFPALERTMRETEWGFQQHPSGYLPHRVLLPLYLPRPWGIKTKGPDNPALDGLLGGILKTYREYRAAGDLNWLAQWWPSVEKALDWVWTVCDPDRRGVIEGEQPNTYDISIYGANAFVGTLYLAALRAVESMANLLGESDLAAKCRDTFQRGRAALDNRLWNGEYYIQDVDLAKYPRNSWGTGCHSDQLLGQWWANALGLGYILDEEHVRTAAVSIFRYNFRENFSDLQQQPREFVTNEDQGLLNCTWPRGNRPESPILYCDEVWTGIEYEVAALLLYENEVVRALRILEAVRSRYDGRRQNPWNDVECGDHYVRAMAAWTLLEAATGYQYDASAGEIGFAPRIVPRDFRAPFVARDGWGTFSQQATDEQQVDTLALMHGSLSVTRLHLQALCDAHTMSAKIDEQPVPAVVSRRNNEFIITMDPIVLRAGHQLEIALA